MNFRTRNKKKKKKEKKGQQKMTFSLIFLYLVKYSFAVPQGEEGCHFLSVCIIVLCHHEVAFKWKGAKSYFHSRL